MCQKRYHPTTNDNFNNSCLIPVIFGAFGLSTNNKWRWWMWMVAAIYRRIHSPSRLAWSEGWRMHPALSLHSLNEPSQWKQARMIRPVPKSSTPQQAADYRPISITPVLSRFIERIVVRRYIYPTLSSPPPSLYFADQFAFRPTGSTTAAIIVLLKTITDLLSSEPYVIVISLDFSKAFDTVRHSSLLHKFAQLSIPDYIYNWLADIFYNHSHCTLFRDQQSSLLDITASTIQE